MRKRVFKNGIVLMIVLILLSGCALVKYKKKIAATEIHPIDLKTLEDGVYEGFYDVHLINAKVRVEIEEHKIINLELVEHKYDRIPGEPMIQKVLDKQSLEVDIITGATNSCKTVLKAIEIALNSEKISQLPNKQLLIEKPSNQE